MKIQVMLAKLYTRIFNQSYCKAAWLVILSICLPVTQCTVLKQYIILQKHLSKWVGSTLLEIRFYNFQPLHQSHTLKLLTTWAIDVYVCSIRQIN